MKGIVFRHQLWVTNSKITHTIIIIKVRKWLLQVQRRQLLWLILRVLLCLLLLLHLHLNPHQHHPFIWLPYKQGQQGHLRHRPSLLPETISLLPWHWLPPLHVLLFFALLPSKVMGQTLTVTIMQLHLMSWLQLFLQRQTVIITIEKEIKWRYQGNQLLLLFTGNNIISLLVLRQDLQLKEAWVTITILLWLLLHQVCRLKSWLRPWPPLLLSWQNESHTRIARRPIKRQRRRLQRNYWQPSLTRQL